MPELRTGLTTGTCASAAAKAAALVLEGHPEPAAVSVRLPDESHVRVPIAFVSRDDEAAEAGVRKDAGDDPDITNGAMVVVTVRWSKEGRVVFKAGDGVGTVTRPGLTVPPGEPAINPVPRKMIEVALREVTDRGVEVTVSIPGGRELAARTFNPRLGVEGGLSILGTTGIVRPFSAPALREALVSALRVGLAEGVRTPVLVPGAIGKRAALRHFRISERDIVEVSNEWGYMLEQAAESDLTHVLALGHPGKLAKLATGQWNTHSAHSSSAVPIVLEMGRRALGRKLDASSTVEGLLEDLEPDERDVLGARAAREVRNAILEHVGRRLQVAVVLTNMRGDRIGQDGDLTPWQ